MKRIIIILALFSYCLGAKAQVFTSYVPSGQLLYFYLNGTEAVMTYPPAEIGQAHWAGYAKPTGHVIIPDSVFYYGTKVPLTRIGQFALANCGGITSIYISDGIRTIEQEAFCFVDSLVSISFPATADTICSYHVNYDLLDTVTFRSSIPPVRGVTYMYHNGHFPSVINIPCGSYDEYYNLYAYANPPQNHLHEQGSPNYYVYLACNYDERGAVSVQEQQGNIISCDSSCIILATANDGYRFMYWSNGRTANPDTLFLNSDTTVTAIFSNVPDPQICMVSVQDNHNMVVWSNEEPCVTFRIYREGVVAGEYEAVADIPYGSLPIYIDSASRPMTRSYRYRISALDDDGIEGKTSSVHKTMHLAINQGIGGRWNLQWTPYEGAEYTTYIIYRGTTADSLEQIDIMPADGNTSYTDETATEGEVFYQVGIVMDNGCTSMETKLASISLSNIATNGSTQGIFNIKVDGISIYSEGGRIVVNGTTDEVRVFDMTGRSIRNETLPAGVYMVKIGNYPVRKMVVIR